MDNVETVKHTLPAFDGESAGCSCGSLLYSEEAYEEHQQEIARGAATAMLEALEDAANWLMLAYEAAPTEPRQRLYGAALDRVNAVIKQARGES